MKKLIAIALVLAMAPLASAGLVWNCADNGDGTFGVTLTSDFGVNGCTLAMLMPNDGGAITNPSFNAGFVTYSYAGDPGDWYGEAAGSLVAASASQNGVVTGDLFSFTYTGKVGDTISVLDYPAWGMTSVVYAAADGAITALTGDAVLGTINIVPEPMTMALLGLGGLFIRRRRA